MPTVRMMNESYYNLDAVDNLIRYIARSAIRVGSSTVSHDPREAIYQMKLVKKVFQKEGGRQCRHFIVAFGEEDLLTPEEIWALAPSIGIYYELRYQTFWGLHRSKEGIWHLHFAVNSVGYSDGRMYSEGVGDFHRLKEYNIQSLLPELEVTAHYLPSGAEG